MVERKCSIACEIRCLSVGRAVGFQQPAVSRIAYPYTSIFAHSLISVIKLRWFYIHFFNVVSCCMSVFLDSMAYETCSLCKSIGARLVLCHSALNWPDIPCWGTMMIDLTLLSEQHTGSLQFLHSFISVAEYGKLLAFGAFVSYRISV